MTNMETIASKIFHLVEEATSSYTLREVQVIDILGAQATFQYVNTGPGTGMTTVIIYRGNKNIISIEELEYEDYIAQTNGHVTYRPRYKLSYVIHDEKELLLLALSL